MSDNPESADQLKPSLPPDDPTTGSSPGQPAPGAKPLTPHALPDGPKGIGDSAAGAPPDQPAPGAKPLSSHDLPDELEAIDVDREVAEAMAGMSNEDVAALGGDLAPAVAPVLQETAEPGTALTGTVVGVSGDDVFLDFGTKAQGVVPRSQFGKKEIIEPGRKVDVIVEGYDADSGLLNVYRKGALQRATWTNLERDMIVEGTVTGLNKGGLEVDLKGIRAFMPASQVDIVPMRDISELLGDKIRAKVLEVDRRGKNVLLSRRKYLEEEREKTREVLLASLSVGQIRTGIVGNLAEFGAFIDLGGVDGLAHISDLSWGTVQKVSDVLRVGQEVEVKVLKIDLERNRISLGLKQAQPDPWDQVAERYPVGTDLKVRVVRLASFGVFAELEPGVDGLIPISEMGWGHVKSPGDTVSVGDMVDAVVIRTEPEKRRLALSMKQASPDPWAEVLDSFKADTVVKATITRLTDFGAFAELVPGVEGLIHISEMSDRRINSCSEVVSAGDEVEVRICNVDAEKRRIALSLKLTSPESEPAQADASEPPKPKKKRKKPLRGGLSFEWD